MKGNNTFLFTDASVMVINLPLGRQGDHGTGIHDTHATVQAPRGSGDKGLSGATPTNKHVLKTRLKRLLRTL